MSVFIVTGKLGSGKTLLACMQAQKYLKQKRRIASNVEFNLENLCKPTNDYSRFIRVPDMPTADDLTALGMGCDKYNEEMFGAIFLDEAGIWLNSRKWNTGGRVDLLEFFLYLRKRRWDLWLIVQSLDVVDKQIRAAVAEHVVYCSRSDRYQMPFLPKVILNVVTLGTINFIKMPKFHTAICKYGTSQYASVSDTWYYRGVDYYDAYNTMQQFDADYSAGCYSVLPPAYTLPIYTHSRRIFKKQLLTLPSAFPSPAPPLKKIMKLTKIYFKKFRFFGAFSMGALLAFIVSLVLVALFRQELSSETIVYKNIATEENNQENNFMDSLNKLSEGKQSEEMPLPVRLASATIYKYSAFPNRPKEYSFKDIQGQIITQAQILATGKYTIKGVNRYHVEIIEKENTNNIIVIQR